jgi:cysteinyl-tRNA synthetase
MSKSLGNFFTIREVLEKYSPEVIRYFLISSHYRSQVDYSEDSLKEAQSALARLYQSLRGVEVESTGSASAQGEPYRTRFEQAMDDDFNTPEAIAVLFDLAKALNKARKETPDNVTQLAGELRYLGSVLGILQLEPEIFFKDSRLADVSLQIDESEIENLIQQRNEARKIKDWAESDRIRDYLSEQGVVLDDGREGTAWRRR